MAERIVRSEVAGVVWKIEVKLGQKLSARDPIMTLESMKMEIPVHAPIDGIITRILVEEGEIIGEGHELAVIGR
jgi:acetyl-CoA carboxylase biotin carboxyl carrier protein